LFKKILIKDGKVAGSIYEEPFSSVLGSHKGSLVVVKLAKENRPPPARLNEVQFASARLVLPC